MFKIFRTIYPRKTGSWKLAEESWDKAIAEGATETDIMEGLKADINNWIAEEVEPKFIPMAVTWLNQRRWEGGLSVDITGLSKKQYTEYTDNDWRVYAFKNGLSDYEKQYVPQHMRKELGIGLEVVN